MSAKKKSSQEPKLVPLPKFTKCVESGLTFITIDTKGVEKLINIIKTKPQDILNVFLRDYVSIKDYSTL